MNLTSRLKIPRAYTIIFLVILSARAYLNLYLFYMSLSRKCIYFDHKHAFAIFYHQ